jgi:hypothetical protein
MFNLAEAGQDWELEVTDGARVEEFLDAYEGEPLNDDERFALMALIIASYDDWLEEGNEAPALRERLRRHLLGRFDLHGYTVQYWSLADEDDPENVFAATGLAREVMAAVFGPRERWPRIPFAVKRVIEWPEMGPTDRSLDWMEIADERDGNFSLSWSKYRDSCGGGAVWDDRGSDGACGAGFWHWAEAMGGPVGVSCGGSSFAPRGRCGACAAGFIPDARPRRILVRRRIRGGALVA